MLDPRFAAAIDAYDLGRAVPFAAGAPAAARAVADAGGVVLLGERHGIAENPAVVHELMTSLDIRRLALEWEPELRPVVDRFLAEGRIELELDEAEAAAVRVFVDERRGVRSTPRMLEALVLCSLDGRVTAGHFALLRALHAAGRLQQLILFQAGGGDWSARDRAMADRVLAEWDRHGPLLVVAGNLHTKLAPHRHGVPLGHHLAQAAAAVEIEPEYARVEERPGVVARLAPP